jgi:uncharacterized membrane protein
MQESFSDEVLGAAVIYIKNFSNTTLKEIQSAAKKDLSPDQRAELRKQLLVVI